MGQGTCWPITAHKKTQRPVALAISQPLERRRDGDVFAIINVFVVVETIVGRLFVMPDLAKGHDFVTKFLQVGGKFFDGRPRLGVVRLRAVPGGHEAG